MKAALYVRVSTRSKRAGDVIAPDGTQISQYLQNPEVQEAPLKTLAESRGWEIHRVYSDRMSGSDSWRPMFRQLLEDARRGLFQVVVVWRFDRFARSAKDLVTALDEFRSIGIEFVSHQEALDTSTPMGRAMFTIIAAIAELERNIIQERIRSGMDYARDKGTRSGKAIGRPRAIFNRGEVLGMRARGMSLRRIAAAIGVSEWSVRQAISCVERVGPEPKDEC